MKNISSWLLCSLLIPATATAWQWLDLWQTRDQQGKQLLQSGKAEVAAQVFRDKNWQGVAHYRAGNYARAYQTFSTSKTSDGQYNAGNAAASMAHYQDAIAAYDKAIALNPNNQDAITNREIIKKLLQQQKPQQKNDTTINNTKDNNSKSNATQKKTAQQNQKQAMKNSQLNNDQPKSENNLAQKPNKLSQNGHSQKSDPLKLQRPDETNQQLLRRVADDPGSLLQQKFLRDYVRRHAVDENVDQGAY